MKEERKSFLLIGNSRWHWAFKTKDGCEFVDASVESEYFHNYLNIPLCAWAAVGDIPSNINLNPALRIKLQDIPLLNAPSWLGIDRALAAWGALNKAKHSSSMHSQGLLIADAGTILSLTRIAANGKFLGGQLVPGLKLQLTAMAQGAKNLQYPSLDSIPIEQFPMSTEKSMIKGSLQALIGTIIEAQTYTKVPIWLCGGDATLLLKALKARNIDVIHQPNLVLEGMCNIHYFLQAKPKSLST